MLTQIQSLADLLQRLIHATAAKTCIPSQRFHAACAKCFEHLSCFLIAAAQAAADSRVQELLFFKFIPNCCSSMNFGECFAAGPGDRMGLLSELVGL